MTTAADAFQPRGGGVLAGLLAVIGALVFLSPLAAMPVDGVSVPAAAQPAAQMSAADSELEWAHSYDAAVDTGAVAVDVPQMNISQHAWEKHPDIAEAVSAYGSGNFLCAELLRSVSTNRYLLRVRFAQFKSELGIITTLSGIGRTAFRAEARYWDKVVVDYEYQPVLRWGQCAQWAQ